MLLMALRGGGQVAIDHALRPRQADLVEEPFGLVATLRPKFQPSRSSHNDKVQSPTRAARLHRQLPTP